MNQLNLAYCLFETFSLFAFDLGLENARVLLKLNGAPKKIVNKLTAELCTTVLLSICTGVVLLTDVVIWLRCGCTTLCTFCFIGEFIIIGWLFETAIICWLACNICWLPCIIWLAIALLVDVLIKAGGCFWETTICCCWLIICALCGCGCVVIIGCWLGVIWGAFCKKYSYNTWQLTIFNEYIRSDVKSKAINMI